MARSFLHLPLRCCGWRKANTHVVRLAGDTGRATTQIKTGSLIVTGDDSGLITLHHGYSKRFKRVSAATIMANDDGEGGAADQ